jgi:hypothetical protein
MLSASNDSAGTNAKAREPALDLSKVCGHWFSERELAEMRVIWSVLVREFFQRFIRPDGQVLDLGAGTATSSTPSRQHGGSPSTRIRMSAATPGRESR